ncbi:MAG: di-heme-cytochrome C peroxidase [Acidobacteriaceae bacterium]
MKSHSSSARIMLCAIASAVAISSVVGFVVLADQPPKPVVLLDQGWNTAQRHLYYYTSQGAFFMPAAWLEALEAAEPARGRFMAPENMTRMGFVFDSASDPKNPYHWPIGFAIDTENKDGIPQAGPTCALCHNGQIEYRGKAVRIDGGQANFNAKVFTEALFRAVITTGKDPSRRARFTKAAVRLGYPQNRIKTDFDALYDRMSEKWQELPLDQKGNTPTGRGRADAVNGIATAIFVGALGEKSNNRPADAPVDYPYLWDIWLFDYVQYNASARQPMGRDVSEAMGQAGVLRLLDPTTGEILPEAGRWHTTIRARNLYKIRSVLDLLKPPPWPEEVLGKINRTQAAQGKALFTANCASCHGIKIISGTTNPTEWHVPVIPLTRIGTDPTHAVNFASLTYNVTKLGLGKHTTLIEGLNTVASAVKRQAYLNAGIPKSEWAEYDGFGRKDDSSDAIPACGYRARPMIGVWAKGPFLHNGSVPTIYDLLSDSRPASFVFGSPEYDPHKLGLVQDAGTGTMVLDTKLPGNSNAGHWFTNDASRPGKIGRALNDQEKFAIIEYLKGATEADYPTDKIAKPGPQPCEDNPKWPKNWAAAATK